MKQLNAIPDFYIQSDHLLSTICRQLGLWQYHQVLDYVYHLAYGRNTDKSRLELIFVEGKGTCSTKHAALVEVARENEIGSLELMLGIYEMNEENTPGVGKILSNSKLNYIPEAHVYLRCKNERFDLTRPVKTKTSPFDCLLDEQVIQPHEITDFKNQKHQDFLQQWIHLEGIEYSFDDLWFIRESCIKALAFNIN